MPGPSPDDARLLEPVNIATVIAESSDSDLSNEQRQLDSETDNDGFIRKTLGIGFWIAVGWFALMSIMAILAPVLPFLQDPLKINPRIKFAPPSTAHWLGTDQLGRDVFSRIIWGARVSLAVGFAAILLGLIVGVLVGLLAGYLKGWTDNVLMSSMDIILAFPALLLAMSIITFTDGRDIPHISLAIGIVAIPAIARLVRASTLTFREREFVLASRTLGASHLRVIAREILPNVVPPVLSFSVIGVAVAIAAEAGLAFVGISVPLPTPTWGGMINDGRSDLASNPQIVFIPCLILVLTIMALYFAGDKLRQYFDVKEGLL